MIVKPKILVLYHFYFPDDVAGSRHFQDLCEDLAELNWDVEVWPCNRKHGEPNKKVKLNESWHDVKISRVWRPVFSQAEKVGRVLNSVWMILAWVLGWIFYFGERPQVVLIGTDPILGLLSAVVIRLVGPKVKIVHWCFDLYPEAAISDQRIKQNSLVHSVFSWAMENAYKACDAIVDLGSCMKTRLQKYASKAIRLTLTPWAFYEPSEIAMPNPEERHKLFGDSQLGILYSGNFGLAHEADLSLKLAGKLPSEKIKFCFSSRGHRAELLKKLCQESELLVNFTDFAHESGLNKRLEAADIHLVSLKSAWTGTVVPSKFFGAIAAGRPILFEGAEDSAIARWIRQHGLGWVLTENSMNEVESDLKKIANDPERLKNLQQHCLRVYNDHFCRKQIMSKWNDLLKEVVSTKQL